MLRKIRFRWERTHPCGLNAIAFKSVRVKFNLILGKGFYAAKRDVARKDACAPSDENPFCVTLDIKLIHVIDIRYLRRRIRLSDKRRDALTSVAFPTL